MNKFADFTNSMSKLESEAWDWIVRLDADEPLSEREKSIFAEWLSRSPAHIEHIRRLNEFWDSPELIELLEPKQEAAGKQQPSQSWFKPVYAYSFALMLCAVGLISYLGVQSANNPELAVTESIEQNYSTDIGQQLSITLADGSQVALNAESQIQIAYTADTRDIWLLKGAAHFEVAKDKARPFNVHAGSGRVQAVGTAFSVDLVKSTMQVLVTEGRIALDVATQNVAMMGAGEFVSFIAASEPQQAIQTIRQNIVRLSQDEIEAKQAWTRGEIILTGESLQEVVEQLRRYSKTEIQIADPSLADLQIGGRFKINQLDTLFESLELNFGVDIEHTPSGKIIISRTPVTD